MVRTRKLKIYFDGGCRPNPGPIEVAAVIRGEVFLRYDLGSGTNGDAEWLALIHAMECAQVTCADSFDLLGDSRSVIAQVNGTARPASQHDKAFLERFQALATIRPPNQIRWVKRSQNLAGIALNRRHPR